MGNENLPIDKIKSTLLYIITTVVLVQKQLSDGFQPFQDIVAMLPAGIQAQQVVVDFPEFVKQAQNVDLSEQVELVEFISKEYRTDNENAKLLIRSGSNAAIAINTFAWDLRSVVSKGDTGTGNG